MMTEQVGQSFGQSVQVASSPAATPMSAPVNPAPTPRTYSDDEVNHIAVKKKQQGFEKGYEAARAELMQQYQAPVQQAQASPSQVSQRASGVSTEEARAIATEEFNKNVQAHQYNAMAQEFVGKLNSHRAKIENFDQVEKDLNLPQNPALWVTANAFDNPAAILAEIWKSPSKLAQLKTLYDSPAMLKRGMQEIADSIKTNEEAKEEPVAPAPLSRQKPSNLGAESGKKQKDLSDSDWKKILRV